MTDDIMKTSWQLAALSRDVTRKPVHRTVAGTPIALFRTSSGIAALVDRCPHRNYPLSLGRVEGDTLVCPYHGWAFRTDGTCESVPGCAIDRRDEMYGFHRHIYDVTRPFFLFGRDRLVAGLSPPPEGTILEVGCGTARNLVKVARMWPGTRLHGIDISREMLDTASTSVARHGLSDRIVLKQGDAGQLDVAATFGRTKFDRIFFSYTLSMMPPWQEALRRAAACLAPGGSLHVVDFGQYDRLPSALRRMHLAMIGSHHVFPRGNLREVLERIGDDLDLGLEFVPMYRGYAWSAVLRR